MNSRKIGSFLLGFGLIFGGLVSTCLASLASDMCDLMCRDSDFRHFAIVQIFDVIKEKQVYDIETNVLENRKDFEKEVEIFAVNHKEKFEMIVKMSKRHERNKKYEGKNISMKI
jgi:hypothetical protein